MNKKIPSLSICNFEFSFKTATEIKFMKMQSPQDSKETKDVPISIPNIPCETAGVIRVVADYKDDKEVDTKTSNAMEDDDKEYGMTISERVEAKYQRELCQVCTKKLELFRHYKDTCSKFCADIRDSCYKDSFDECALCEVDNGRLFVRGRDKCHVCSLSCAVDYFEQLDSIPSVSGHSKVYWYCKECKTETYWWDSNIFPVLRDGAIVMNGSCLECEDRMYTVLPLNRTSRRLAARPAVSYAHMC